MAAPQPNNPPPSDSGKGALLHQLRIDRSVREEPEKTRRWPWVAGGVLLVLIAAGVGLLRSRHPAVLVHTAMAQPMTTGGPSASVLDATGYVTAAERVPDPALYPDADPALLVPGSSVFTKPDGPVDLRMMVGHCSFGSPDAYLLVSLLPQLVHVRGEERLATLVQLVRDESRGQRPAREVVLSRLLEVLLIEALRSTAETTASPGLVRGLSDCRLAAAIRGMHEHPTRAWTVAELAKEAALSRSTFFERFNRAVGVAPMEYLLTWRMALAKDLLRRNEGRVADVAQRVGYSSASTFSVAFTRHVGRPPSQYAREEQVVIEDT